MKWAVYYLAKEAGLVVNEEPQTSNLLLQQFSPMECRALFPKTSTKAMKAELMKLKEELKEIEAKPPGTKKNVLRRVFENTCKLLQKQYQSKGLRIDLQLIDPFSLQERWIDTTCIHATCKSRLKNELKDIQEKLQAEKESKQGERNYPHIAQSGGNAVRQQTIFKHAVYSQLVAIGRKQFHQGRRTQEPIFLAAVATTNAEFGKELIMLQEFLTAAYGRALIRYGDRDDGSKLKTCTANYRNRFRTRIVMAIAKGHSRMLNECGLPRKSCNKYS